MGSSLQSFRVKLTALLQMFAPLNQLRFRFSRLINLKILENVDSLQSENHLVNFHKVFLKKSMYIQLIMIWLYNNGKITLTFQKNMVGILINFKNVLIMLMEFLQKIMSSFIKERLLSPVQEQMKDWGKFKVSKKRLSKISAVLFTKYKNLVPQMEGMS